MDEFDLIDDEDEDWICEAYRPESGPSGHIYMDAVPIWTGKTHRELAEELGGEYACGFAWGFESAIIMSCMNPEWAQALMLALREHYLATHTKDEIGDWPRQAMETALAIPMQRTSGNN